MQPLTATFRRAQLVVRSAALRQTLAAYAGFDPDDIAGSWPRVEPAIVAAAGQGFMRSAGAGAAYYGALRSALGVGGTFGTRLAPVPSAETIAGWLELAGPRTAGVLAYHGRPDVYRQTFVSLAGAVGRQVLDGGRQTVVENTKADPQALGWAVATGPEPCAFCAMLASRGPVYKSEETALPGGEWHPNCACEPEPSYSRSQPWPGQAYEYRARWLESGGDAVEFRRIMEGRSERHTEDA